MRGANPNGMITDLLFDQILEKLKSNFPNWQLHFYNWTEPLLHPRIVDYCKAATRAGFHLHLSSNLNYLPDPEGLMASGIKTFRVSLSGFTQQTYERGHRGGVIERVKENMQRLSRAKAANPSCRTKIHVYFHKYRHNLAEIELMEDFAKSLGFEFMSDWAFLMPLEKMLQFINHTLPSHEREFAEESIVPSIHDALSLMAAHKNSPCELIDQLVIDFQGNVNLCCAVYTGKQHGVGNVLDLTWNQLQEIKYRHQSCLTCTSHGIHALYTHLSKPEQRKAMYSLAETQVLTKVKRNEQKSFPLRILDQPLAATA